MQPVTAADRRRRSRSSAAPRRVRLAPWHPAGRLGLVTETVTVKVPGWRRPLAVQPQDHQPRCCCGCPGVSVRVSAVPLAAAVRRWLPEQWYQDRPRLYEPISSSSIPGGELAYDQEKLVESSEIKLRIWEEVILLSLFWVSWSLRLQTEPKYLVRVDMIFEKQITGPLQAGLYRLENKYLRSVW